jgi:hypothetical protein
LFGHGIAPSPFRLSNLKISGQYQVPFPNSVPGETTERILMTANGITKYHACYFAHELTKRCPSDSLQKLAATLADA